MEMAWENTAQRIFQVRKGTNHIHGYNQLYAEWRLEVEIDRFLAD